MTDREPVNAPSPALAMTAMLDAISRLPDRLATLPPPLLERLEAAALGLIERIREVRGGRGEGRQ